jgi:hypothetical protein
MKLADDLGLNHQECAYFMAFSYKPEQPTVIGWLAGFVDTRIIFGSNISLLVHIHLGLEVAS